MIMLSVGVGITLGPELKDKTLPNPYTKSLTSISLLERDLASHKCLFPKSQRN